MTGVQTCALPILYGEITDLFKSENKLNDEFDNTIFVDLSNIEWVNLTSLVELILYIENWVKSGTSVTIALPYPKLLKKEEKAIKEKNIQHIITKKLQRRKNVRGWLFKLGIVEVLSFRHISTENRKYLKLIDNYDHELVKGFHKNNKQYVFQELTGNENNKFPERLPFLIWMDVKEINLPQFSDDLMKCIEKSGFKKDVAIDIAKRIIVELIKNTRDHSTKDYCLFGIAKNPFFNFERELTDDNQISIKEFKHPGFLGKNYLFDEFSYYQKITNEERMIEIAFGDTGFGIPESLKTNSTKEYQNVPDNDLLQLSFDKWSSKIPYNDKSTVVVQSRGRQTLGGISININLKFAACFVSVIIVFLCINTVIASILFV